MSDFWSTNLAYTICIAEMLQLAGGLSQEIETSLWGYAKRTGDDPEQNRRRQRDSLDPDPDEAPAQKKHRPIILSPKRRPTDEYAIAARLVTRIIDMNWEPFAVVNAGVPLLAMGSKEEIELEMASASDQKKALYDIFLVLSERIPGLEESEDWGSVRQRLDSGKKSAKTEDNHEFKVTMPGWRKWKPPIKSDSKYDRGLNHPQCAKYLAPVDVDWRDRNARNKFRNESDPPMLATGFWPAFLYKDSQADLQNLSKGLLKSKLMLQAARGVLLPRSVANSKRKGRAGPDHQSNRKSKAEIYKMNGVTPGFLAYVAVEVRYALSSETTFNRAANTFDYVRFYNDIMAYLTDPACEKEVTALKKWWDTLFPPKRTDPVAEPSSMVANLRTQAQERQAQAESDVESEEESEEESGEESEEDSEEDSEEEREEEEVGSAGE